MLKCVVGMNPRRWLGSWTASLLVIGAIGSSWPTLAEDKASIPNFAPDSLTGWLKPPGDEFIQPESGPGPVRADPAHPYVPNSAPYVSREAAAQQTAMIADLTNPILQPWVVEKMRKSNEEVLAGRSGSRPARAAGPTVCRDSCSIRCIRYFSFRPRRKW